MNEIYLPYIIIQTAAGLLAALIAWHAWRRRALPGSSHFVLLMVAVAEWAFVGAAELASTEIEVKIFWAKLSYLGLVSVAPAWLLFVLNYSQQSGWLAGRRGALLWVLPLIIIGLALTNEWHHLIWTRITPFSEAPGALLVYDHGPAGWISTFYGYFLLLIGAVMLIQTTQHTPALYRWQIWTLLVGLCIPWLANILYFIQWPLPGLDLTPVAFATTGLVIAWNIFRFQLFDLVPIARDALVENMRDGVLLLDAHNRIVDLNPAASQLINRSSAETIGQPAEIALTDWPELLATYRETVETPTEVRLDRERSEQWLESKVTLLRDQQQRLTGRLIVLHDITARKQTEAALRQFAQELQAKNNELDAFTHTVAHDLKNPLAVLVGYSELLENDENDLSEKNRQQCVSTITRLGLSMANIIDELLLLATVDRIEDVKIGPVDMSDVVANALARLSYPIAEAHAEITIPERFPVVVSHSPWLEQVWINYMSNAIKYGGNPPQIEVGFNELEQPDAQGGLQFRFWVRDNGPGLTREEQAKLFTEFTRLSRIRIEGHGLGLSIVRRIVKKLGGQAGVESKVGQGSTFWFTLPGPRA